MACKNTMTAPKIAQTTAYFLCIVVITSIASLTTPAHAQVSNTTPSKVAVTATAPSPAAFVTTQNRRSTPSKIAVNAPAVAASIPATHTNSRANVPILSASVSMPSHNNSDLVADTISRQARTNALTSYLASPSKTSMATLGEQNSRFSLLPVQVDANSVLIVDQDTQEVIYNKNAEDVLPIASITKLMSAMVLLDAKQSMNERITITQADVDTLKNSSSRLAVGTKLTRQELFHLMLMSSENRAAHALARNYPGGLRAFVAAMNKKAQVLGMTQTRYVDPTGLNSQNRSSARDLVWLTKAAYEYNLIRQWSTSEGHKVSVGRRQLQYINSNRLIDDGRWNIGVQKTGYIRESGHCLVMQASISGRRVIMVFLNANGSKTRMNDAEKIRTLVAGQSRQYSGNSVRQQ